MAEENSGAAQEMRIKVAANGPYLVSGSVPLDEKIIRSEGHGYRWEDGRTFEQQESYALCRCGHSNTAPFCDGTHKKIGFIGRETASKQEYQDRVDYFEGPVIDLADDDRCAFARFCHAPDLEGNGSEAWSLAVKAENDEQVELAKEIAGHCPAGRLTVRTHEGEFIEPDLEPGITIVQDPERGVSSGIYVHGGIALEDSEGNEYELRNRYMLCRCGASRNKPYCDAFHVPMRYNDGFLPGAEAPEHPGTVSLGNPEVLSSPRSGEEA